MKEIQLTQSKVALVDDEDFEYLNQFKWHARKCGNSFYARKNIGTIENANRGTHLMHRIIMNATDPQICVDHKDGNGLNNQKSNLRICNHQQNNMNQRHIQNGSSIYKGVCWHKEAKKWVSNIHFNKMIYLGLFDNETEAAKAYDQKAIELFGEFARLNFAIFSEELNI